MAATAYRLKVAVAWIFVFIAVGCGAVAGLFSSLNCEAFSRFPAR